MMTAGSKLPSYLIAELTTLYVCGMEGSRMGPWIDTREKMEMGNNNMINNMSGEARVHIEKLRNPVTCSSSCHL